MNLRHHSIARLLFAALAGTGIALSATAAERVADEGTIGDAWALAEGATLAQAAYPAHLAARGGSACIALGYLISPDGGTSDFQLLKAWNSESGEVEPVAGYWQAFADAGADAVGQWRFQPKPGVASAVPTRTVATIGFQGPAGGTPAEVRAHCRITGLGEYLAKLEHDRAEQGDMNRHALDRAMQAQRRAEARAAGSRNGN